MVPGVPTHSPSSPRSRSSSGEPSREVALPPDEWAESEAASKLRATCYHPLALSGQAGAYFALFSEIGIFLLVTTLIGALAGNWVDKQLGTVAIFTIAGFLGGAAIGVVGIYRLITRFLARYD